MRTLLSLMLVAACGHLAAAAELTTPWERDSATTPRYAETVAWCRQLADAHPTVALTTFGRSPEERDLPLVIWDADGLRDPAAVHAAGRTVVLIQACIHAGESCGKDAGMTLVRDLAELGGPADLCVLFIPIFNVDGHERFGPYNRVNQNGPREMGWRVTAQNLNLNRDFLKADAPEMRAWLALWNAWSPHFLVDIHSTDGADYQYAISYGLELHGNLDAGLTGWLTGYLGAMEAAMAADGLPLVPYVSFRRWHDPRSGLESWVAGPRFSQGYAAVRNRPGLLIETHMLKPYPVRVAATRALLDHTLAYLAAGGPELQALAAAADRHATSSEFRAAPLPLRWAATDVSHPIPFLGMAYEAVASELSGGEWFRYHPDRPDTFLIDVFDEPAVAAAADVPEAYLVPPAWTEVVERLGL
ncbi:MAG: M14 family metallopeptidase, partial [Candidatus Krumholzibacteriia bacterium]